MLPLVNTFIAIMATVSLCTLTILLIVYVDIDFVRYRGAKAVKQHGYFLSSVVY